MNEVQVEFAIGVTKIKTTAKTPSMSMVVNEEGIRVVTINNAISQVKKDTGLDLRKLVDNIHEYADILYWER